MRKPPQDITEAPKQCLLGVHAFFKLIDHDIAEAKPFQVGAAFGTRSLTI